MINLEDYVAELAEIQEKQEGDEFRKLSTKPVKGKKKKNFYPKFGLG